MVWLCIILYCQRLTIPLFSAHSFIPFLVGNVICIIDVLIYILCTNWFTWLIYFWYISWNILMSKISCATSDDYKLYYFQTRHNSTTSKLFLMTGECSDNTISSFKHQLVHKIYVNVTSKKGSVTTCFTVQGHICRLTVIIWDGNHYSYTIFQGVYLPGP